MKNNYKNSRHIFKRKGSKQVLAKLSNTFCKHGKKHMVLNALVGLLRTLKVKKKRNSIIVLKEAIHNITPLAEIKAKVRGRITYKIPVPVSEYRERGLGIKILSRNVPKRLEQSFGLRLTGEILDSFEKKSNSYKAKLDLNKEIKQGRSLVRMVSIV